ncbi:MAG TPA: cupin domain-containing protein [Cyclobacteriaceae bacterium]|nr:cupin domain-containing protein [Cyclobacteriaceae bacterium]
MEFFNSKRAFEWVLHPLEPRDFFQQYYETKHLHIKRNDRLYYNNLLNLKSLSDLMYNQVLRFPDVRIVNSKNSTISPDSYTYNGNKIKVDQVMKHFNDGATIIFSALHDYLPSMGLLTDFLTKDFNHRFQTNIYLTPKNSQGFKVHYDTHDVFILQTEGSKLWKLYSTPIALPLKTQEFETGKVEHGEVVHEVLLEKGDMLYVPRGLMHEAEATDEISMHITTGLLGYTWCDLLIESALRLSKENVEFRKNLPLHENSTEGWLAYLTNLVDILKSQMDFQFSKEVFVSELIKNQRPNIKNAFENILMLDQINVDTEVFLHDQIMFKFNHKGNEVTIELMGNQIVLPDYTLEAINFISQNSTRSFLVSELPDCMDDDGKVVLIKRLIREGLLGVKNIKVEKKELQILNLN